MYTLFAAKGFGNGFFSLTQMVALQFFGSLSILNHMIAVAFCRCGRMSWKFDDMKKKAGAGAKGLKSEPKTFLTYPFIGYFEYGHERTRSIRATIVSLRKSPKCRR